MWQHQGMQGSTGLSAPGKQFLAMALVSAVVIAAAVVLWVTDVIGLGAMIGAVAVVGVLELIWVIGLQRRMRHQRARTDRLSAQGGASTIDSDSPNVQYGYDPMDGFDDGARR